MKVNYRIAIDGPSGAGKSTIAKAVASKQHIDYIDTGAMYRAIGYKMLRDNIPMVEDDNLMRMLDDTEIDFVEGNIILDGEVVNNYIRTPEISRQASQCAKFMSVRNKLVQLQRAMAETKSAIMDGRDIGTVVLKDAEYKFFLTASLEERARRRYNELQIKGENVRFEEILQDIKQRDYNDMHRDITPLKKADDAEEINSDNMSIDDVVDYICGKINNK